MSRRVLVLWSGGVESTSLLLRLLTTTDWQVYAHFIEMVNPEQRHIAEKRAIESLRPHLDSIRPINFTSSYVSMCQGQSHIFDYHLHYTLGLSVMQNYRCDCLLRAWCMEDEWERRWTDGELHVERPDSTPGARYRSFTRRLRMGLGEDADVEHVAPFLPSFALPKAAHLKYLGNLASLTWSCRRPVGRTKECGHCHTCLELAAARKGGSSIPEVDALIKEKGLDALLASV